jgi:hypothetical protein
VKTPTRAFCRTCSTATTWTHAGTENHGRPEVDYWRCVRCGTTRIQMADVTDAEQLVRTTMNAGINLRLNREIRDEIEAELTMHLVREYAKWDRRLCPDFTAFASERLRNRMIDVLRRTFRVLGHASLTESLDGILNDDDGDVRLEPTFGSWPRDRETRGVEALGRVLTDRGRGVARAERELGVGSDERAPV